MLGLPVRYWLKHPLIAITDIAKSPLEVVRTMQDFYFWDRERLRPRHIYEATVRWEHWLHLQLGCEWPCPIHAEFWELWNQVMEGMRAMGIDPGPDSYDGWNDGDAGLVRAVWCLNRHLQPENVIETGVAHGVTSRFILEALKKNGRGHLWSIDLQPLMRTWRKQVGIAVGDGHGSRWTYVEGSSRGRLPKLLAQVGRVDLFIHDSLHSERNVRFELDHVWPQLNTTAAMVVDDADSNLGFHSFQNAHPAIQGVICDSEPVRPEFRAANQKGQFGILLKMPARAAQLDDGDIDAQQADDGRRPERGKEIADG